MKTLLQKENIKLFLFALLVLISRLPFLNAGYGVEEDSWGIALAAYNTHATGVMEASRLPGHPVNEFIYALLWNNGSWLYNFLSTLCSVVCFLLFDKIAKQLNVKQHLLASLAFVFTPVVYINSTCTIDYLWASMFCLASFYFLINKKYLLAGILLGLSVGCRITNLSLLFPFAIWIYFEFKNQSYFNPISKLFSITIITSILCYLPIINVYGPGFFTYSDQFPYPNIYKVIYKASIGVFGFIGCVAIIIFSLKIIFTKKVFVIRRRMSYFLYSLFLLQIVAYVLLPQKSAYLITLVPFFILWISYYFEQSQFKLFCAALIISSVIFSINLTDEKRGATHSKYAITKTIAGQEIFIDPLSGPIFSDYSKRKQKLVYTKSIREKSKIINHKCVIISGWWYNQIMVEMLNQKKDDSVKFVFYINESEMLEYTENGYKIYYLSEQEIYNDLMFGINSTKKYAVELK